MDVITYITNQLMYDGKESLVRLTLWLPKTILSNNEVTKDIIGSVSSVLLALFLLGFPRSFDHLEYVFGLAGIIVTKCWKMKPLKQLR